MVKGVFYVIKFPVVLHIGYLYAKVSLSDSVCGMDQIPQWNSYFLMKKAHHLNDQRYHENEHKQEKVPYGNGFCMNHPIVQTHRENEGTFISIYFVVDVGIGTGAVFIGSILFF